MSNNFSIDDALFNMDAASLLKDDVKKGSSFDDLYRPSAKDGKDNIYRSVIRFIPYVKDPQQSISSKWTVWLTNLNTDQSKMIDCPSSVKEKSVLQDIYFSLKKSDNAREQDLAANFTRRESFYSLVQIIKDPNNPELEGKIKIFKYGKKIYDKLKNIMNPDDDMTDTNNPFDLFTGKQFVLHIKIVSNFNNYDDSSFLSKDTPFEIDGVPMKKNKEDFEKIKKYLQDNSPDLGKYGYKPWDDETKSFVLDAIESILPSGKIKSRFFGNGEMPRETDKTTNAVSRAKLDLIKENTTEQVKINIKRDELDDMFEEAGSKPAKAAKKPSKPVAVEEEDDDIYKDLDDL